MAIIFDKVRSFEEWRVRSGGWYDYYE